MVGKWTIYVNITSNSIYHRLQTNLRDSEVDLRLLQILLAYHIPDLYDFRACETPNAVKLRDTFPI